MLFVLNQVQKLDMMFNAAVSAVETCEKKCGCHGAQHTHCLQTKISDYFNGDINGDIPNKMDQSRYTKLLLFREMHRWALTHEFIYASGFH